MTEERMNMSAPEDGSEDFAALLAEHDAVADRVHPGQKVTGTIIEISGDSVFVNIGIKIDGVMDRKDILDADGKETLAVGDTIELYVTGVSSQEIRLSRSMGGSGMAALEEARDAAVPVDGRVVATCKGGYTVEVLGKTAFCPGSQMDAVSVADAESMVGRTLQFLVLRVENRGRNIVVSRRALLDRERQENLEKVLAELNVGDTVEGRITRTAPFGAFVELAPGIEGLVHISELSWTKRVHKAEDVVNVGDVVNVKVKEVNADARRISLSLRDAEGDPWQDAATRFAAGTVVTGTVESRAQFGLFVNLAPGITGLLPAGVIKGCKNAAELNKLDKGDSVTLTVQNLDTAARRISLAPEGYKGAPAREDHSWKQHASTNTSSSAGGLNIMAQALQKAMQNKR